MPRKARIDAPGAVHHIIARGIESRDIFNDDVDRQGFVLRLGRIVAETGSSCFAWALMPNHFHLLLGTGAEPVSRFMSRLLTGHATGFNRRHERHGHLFQNRYKSILCQKDPYFLELVRYIHLNPLRAAVVANTDQLCEYPYAGHGALCGFLECDWQSCDAVLRRFGDHPAVARQRYIAFIEQGIGAGRRPDLVGGGLLRSTGGWDAVKEMRQTAKHMKSDERILGNPDFVAEALAFANEQVQRRYAILDAGRDFSWLLRQVAELCGMDPSAIVTPGKQPARVKARSLVSFWATRELGMTATAVGDLMGITQSAVSKAAQRGERIVADLSLVLDI